MKAYYIWIRPETSFKICERTLEQALLVCAQKIKPLFKTKTKTSVRIEIEERLASDEELKKDRKEIRTYIN